MITTRQNMATTGQNKAATGKKAADKDAKRKGVQEGANDDIDETQELTFFPSDVDSGGKTASEFIAMENERLASMYGPMIMVCCRMASFNSQIAYMCMLCGQIQFLTKKDMESHCNGPTHKKKLKDPQRFKRMKNAIQDSLIQLGQWTSCIDEVNPDELLNAVKKLESRSLVEPNDNKSRSYPERGLGVQYQRGTAEFQDDPPHPDVVEGLEESIRLQAERVMSIEDSLREREEVLRNLEGSMRKSPEVFDDGSMMQDRSMNQDSFRNLDGPIRRDCSRSQDRLSQGDRSQSPDWPLRDRSGSRDRHFRGHRSSSSEGLRGREQPIILDRLTSRDRSRSRDRSWRLNRSRSPRRQRSLEEDIKMELEWMGREKRLQDCWEEAEMNEDDEDEYNDSDLGREYYNAETMNIKEKRKEKVEEERRQQMAFLTSTSDFSPSSMTSAQSIFNLARRTCRQPFAACVIGKVIKAMAGIEVNSDGDANAASEVVTILFKLLLENFSKLIGKGGTNETFNIRLLLDEMIVSMNKLRDLKIKEALRTKGEEHLNVLRLWDKQQKQLKKVENLEQQIEQQKDYEENDKQLRVPPSKQLEKQQKQLKHDQLLEEHRKQKLANNPLKEERKLLNDLKNQLLPEMYDSHEKQQEANAGNMKRFIPKPSVTWYRNEKKLNQRGSNSLPGADSQDRNPNLIIDKHHQRNLKKKDSGNKGSSRFSLDSSVGGSNTGQGHTRGLVSCPTTRLNYVSPSNIPTPNQLIEYPKINPSASSWVTPASLTMGQAGPKQRQHRGSSGSQYYNRVGYIYK